MIFELLKILDRKTNGSTGIPIKVVYDKDVNEFNKVINMLISLLDVKQFKEIPNPA